MKKVIFSLALLLTCSLLGYAQKGISYQAVILDPKPIEIPGQDITGQPFVNGEVSLKFKLFSSTFVQEFEEVHVAKTDAYGLVNVLIGSVSPAAFSALVWDINPRSMQVWVSFDQGGTYTKVSEQVLTYSPYALYAETTGTAGKLSGTLTIGEGGTGAKTAANARTNLGLGNVDNTSDANKPVSIATQNALDAKANELTTYVNNQVAAIPDADAATKGKIQLAGDLGGTATAPTVPGLALKADALAVNAALNLKANAADVTNELALKADAATVNAALNLKANAADVANELALKANAAETRTLLREKEIIENKSIDILADAASDSKYPTVKSIKNYVDTQVAAATIADADASTKGKIQLAGDLSGTAAAPTVPGLALKANAVDMAASLARKANAVDVTTALAVKADTTYVLTKVAAATIADASSSTKGKIQLAGDLAGTAAAPTVPGLALKANAADVTSALATKASTTDLTSGLALKANTADMTAALALKAPLASPTFTGTVTTAAITTGALSSTAVTAPTYASAPRTLTYSGSTINWNPALGLNAAITLTQNSTLTFTAAPPVGSYGTVVLTQDGTGGRTLTLPTLQGATNQVLGSTSTSTVALSTAASSKDILNFYYDGTVVYWNIGQGYGAASTTNSGPTNLASSVTGTLAVGNGGTGATTLSGLVKGNGTGAMTAAVVGTDYLAPNGSAASLTNFPTLNQNTTGNAANVTGIVAVANGGTGATTLAANNVLLGNGTSALQVVAPGTTGNVLTSNGTTWTSTAPSASGVPYSGATGAVNLGAYDLTVHGIRIGRGNSGLSYNTVVGLAALNANTTGNYNNAFGSQALAANLDGFFNSAFGQTALFKNTSGYDNSGYGFNALNGNTTGSNNSALGSNSAVNNTTGSSNTAIGMSALALNTTGSNNTAIGYQANVGANNLTNATAIGNGAVVAASNTIQLGNTSVTSVNTSGTITAPIINTPIYASTPQVLTDGSTVVWNPTLGLNASVTLAGNRNLTFLSTPIAGAYGTLVVKQDGTGGRTLALPSVTNKVLGSSSTTTIALSTTANAIDIVNFYYDGSNYFWNVGQGYGSAAIAATTTNLASSVTGTLPVANGGTGAATLTGLVKGNGTGAMTAAVAGTDFLAPTGSAAGLTNFPTLNQNTTGNAANVTGTVAVANGGTGATNASTALSNLGGAPLASPALTGTPTAPTAAANTNTTQLATTAFVTSALASSGLPSQSGNSGKFLTTNGTTTSWASTGSSGVPYSGASGAVNLGDYNLTVYGIKIGTSGTDNTALQRNLIIGRDVLVNNTYGYGNMAIGNTALYTNVGGNANISIGNESQYYNVWGNSNTSIGQATLYKNVTGNYNTALGTQAGYFLTSSGNTAIGYNALDGQGDGGGNTGVGYNAGGVPWDQRTYNSTFLGYNAKAQSGLDNVTVIGYNAYTSEHHTIQLGDHRILKLKTSGTVWSNGSQLTSDLRLKTNIQPITNTLDLIMKLNPVHYNKKNSIESSDYNKTENGFIAQELQKVLPYLVSEGTDKDKILSVDYNSIIPVLTKGIQEQQALIEAQQKQIDEMKLILEKLMNDKK